MAKKNFHIAECENTALWRDLQTTNPDATKPFTRAGGFSGTQIDPTWRVMRMTEKFGPVGRGWGWEQVGQPIVTPDCVFICARAWWLDGHEQRWTGPQWGGTELYRRRKDGSKDPNDEAFKMAMTDAIGKCLVQLGLAADVHLGLFDDSKYREEAAEHYREQKADTAGNKPGPEDIQRKLIGKLFREWEAPAWAPQFWSRKDYSVPVPKDHADKDDWPAWLGRMVGLANVAPNADAIEKLKGDNEGRLRSYQKVSQEGYGALIVHLNHRADALLPNTMQAAE